MIAISVAAALVAAIASWMAARSLGQRALVEAVYDAQDRGERNRALLLDRFNSDRRAQDAVRQAAEAERQTADAERQAALDALRRSADDRAAVAAEALDLAEDQRGLTAIRLERVETQRAALERSLTDHLAKASAREAHLTSELTRWQTRSRSLAAICQLDAVVEAPLFTDRPAPVELDAIARRARGLALVDGVTVADRDGLPLDRGGTRDSDDLAALAPAVGRFAIAIDSALGQVRRLAIYTDDARVVELRVLPGWTDGAWLVAQSSTQPPPPAALDAAVAYAHAVRDVPVVRGTRRRLVGRGRLGPGGDRRDALGDELEHATRGLGVCTVALVLGDHVLAGVEADGIGAGGFAKLLASLHALKIVARARLRANALARIEIDIEWGARLSLASLGAGSRLDVVTVTVGRPLDPLEVERVVGRLRRFMDGQSPVQLASASNE